MADSVGGGFPSVGIQKGHTFFDIDNGTVWEYLGGIPQLASSWKLLNGNVSVDPDTSLWGEAQAGAIWFNVADKIYKGWNGAEIVLLNNDVSSLSFYDDFLGTSTSSDALPILGWTFGVIGSATLIESLIVVANHPGIWRIRTGAVASDTGIMSLGPTGAGIIPAMTTFIMTFIIQTGPVVSATTIRMGGDVQPISGSHLAGAYFEKQSADANWSFTTSIGGGAGTTRVDSGVPVLPDTFYRFDLRRVGNKMGFRIDLGAETFITTNIYDGPNALCPFYWLRTTDGVAKDLFMDYYRVQMLGLTR
jgi:hypothetical protein